MTDSEHAPSARLHPAARRRVGDGPGTSSAPSWWVLCCPRCWWAGWSGEFGVAAMITGLLLGIVGAKIGGTRRMLYLSPGVGIAAGIGAFTAYDWTWVALLTLVG